MITKPEMSTFIMKVAGLEVKKEQPTPLSVLEIIKEEDTNCTLTEVEDMQEISSVKSKSKEPVYC